MRLAPRHYLLLLVLIALAAYNGVRFFRAHHREVGPMRVVYLDRSTSPQWQLFDKAAALRDAGDAEFSPALAALSQAIDSSNSVAVPPTTSPADITALKGCRTWLLFYRQAVLHPGATGQFSKEETGGHVTSCAASHSDTAQ